MRPGRPCAGDPAKALFPGGRRWPPVRVTQLSFAWEPAKAAPAPEVNTGR